MKEDVEEIGRLMAKVIRGGWAAVKPYTEVALGVLFLLWELGTLAGAYDIGISWGSLIGLSTGLAVGTSRLRPNISVGAAAITVAFLVLALSVSGYLQYHSSAYLSSSDAVACGVVGLLVVCFVHAKRPVSARTSAALVYAGKLWPWLCASTLFAAATFFGMQVGYVVDGYASVSGLLGQFLYPIVASAVLAAVIVLAVWLTGYTVRVRRERRADAERQRLTEDQLRRADLDLLVTKERDRIAQDVHDIMAHSLSVIVAQADGARLIRERAPEAVDASLEEIARSARTSLTEVRMLIESLVNSPEGHSHPTLENVGELVERMRSAGLDTTVESFGAPLELTPTQQLAVYRILQEALTNALKHAGANAHARVVTDWRGLGLALTVTSGGEGGPASVPDDAPGRGLYGMRERARLGGGWVTAGPDESSGEFVVSAYIPRADEEPTDAAGATAPMPARTAAAPAVREERTEVLADPEAATEPLEDLADAGRAGAEGVDDRGTESSDTEGSGADEAVSEQAGTAPSVPPRSGARA